MMKNLLLILALLFSGNAYAYPPSSSGGGGAPTGAAGGDLSGTYPNPTVAKLNGVAAASYALLASPALTGTVTYNGTALGTLATLGIGTGLTSGSGNLSVSYGTTSGTAAQGNDSRITGAVQSTATPAGGDITNTYATPYVASAGKAAGNANYFTLAGGGTGVSPQITATGSDTNVNLTLYSKGNSAAFWKTDTNTLLNLQSTSGSTANSVFIGSGAGINAGGTSTGSVVIGGLAGGSAGGAGYLRSNVIIGYQAGSKMGGTNAVGQNVVIGYEVGENTIGTGGNNILIGTSSSIDTPLAATNYYLNIGGTITGTLTGGTTPALASSASWSAPQFIATGSTPTIAGGTGDGSVTPTFGTGSTNMAGVINLTTGATPTASATIATITFNGTLNTAPQGCTLMPRNAATALAVAMVYTTAPSTTTWTMADGGTALTGATAYSWSYICE